MALNFVTSMVMVLVASPGALINILDSLVAMGVGQGVADAVVAVGEEPVAARRTSELVGAGVVVHRGVCEDERSIQAAAALQASHR